jgi:hypothetical protein
VRKDEQEQPDAPPRGKTNPLENMLSSILSPAPSQERGGQRGRKGARARLKDMLGFSERDAAAKSARPDAPAPDPAQLPEPPAHRAPEPPQAERESTQSAPEFLVPGESMPLNSTNVEAATPRRPEPPRAPATPRASEPPAVEAPSWIDEPPVVEAPEWMEVTSPVRPLRPQPPVRHDAPQGMDPSPVLEPEILPVSAVEPQAAEPELNEPEPVEPEPAAPESDDAARLTAAFLLNSPVLSSQARPVTRRGAPAPASRAAPLVNTSALQILQLATELDRLGVPEAQRPLARAFLMDLARLMEKGEVSWDVLRDAMQMVMQFPPLARRAMPLLLPYLDQAA